MITKSWVDMNYEKIYNKLIAHRRMHTPTEYKEEHHVIPVSLGGVDDKSNLVYLTAREHFICHLLLLKMQRIGSSDYYKMLTAFLMMAWCHADNQVRHVSSRIYDAKKREYADWKSKSMVGESNHQYGTVWCILVDSKDCSGRKKFKRDSIPDGWISTTDWRRSRISKSRGFGRHWYNDGAKNFYLLPDDEAVRGLVRGRLKTA